MLAIDVGEKAARVRKFLQQYPVGFPLLLDQDSAVAESWSMPGLPTTFVVDPDGRIAYKAAGKRDWDTPGILDLLRSLRQFPGQKPVGLNRLK